MKEKTINFIGKKHYALVFSLLLSVLSVLLLVTKGLNLSIDFKGGTVIDFQTAHNDVESNFKTSLSEHYQDFEVNRVGDTNNYSLKMGSGADVDFLTAFIRNKLDDVEISRVDYIGPKIGAEFAADATKAVVFSLLAMMIYVWVRFDLKFGLGVMLALLHDVLITLGFFSLSGFQFDLTSIAVVLTVVGYSINDSIVIYDRIRENLNVKGSIGKSENFGELINRSINETLSRTIMTSLTTIVVCLALLIFGGDALRGFSAGLSFGIAFGTYSSIYVSAPVLMFFAKA
jgi:preprotein translocase subunit SecF